MLATNFALLATHASGIRIGSSHDNNNLGEWIQRLASGDKWSWIFLGAIVGFFVIGVVYKKLTGESMTFVRKKGFHTPNRGGFMLWESRSNDD